MRTMRRTSATRLCSSWSHSRSKSWISSSRCSPPSRRTSLATKLPNWNNSLDAKRTKGSLSRRTRSSHPRLLPTPHPGHLHPAALTSPSTSTRRGRMLRDLPYQFHPRRLIQLPKNGRQSARLRDITLDPELLRQGNPKGQQVPLPTSLTDKVFKAWLHERTLSNQATYLDLIKQELASDTVEQLKTIAVKWGATVSLVSKGSKRALLQFITVLYMYGK